MLKVCLDTNVWISGLVSTGLPSRIVEGAFSKRFQTITSEPILAELVRNLTRKFGVRSRDANRIWYRISQVADVYRPRGELKLSSLSEQDRLVVETAQLGKARYLVTGDRALLALKHFKYTRTIEPNHFIRIWKADGASS